MRETTRHRKAFDVYFGLGSRRSLARLLDELKSSWERVPGLRTLEQWSRVLGWQARVDVLERKAHEAEDEARVEAIKEMQERQAKEGLLMQQKGTEHLAASEELSTTEATRLVVEGAKLERLARGEVTEITRVDYTDKRLKELSDEELDRVIELARKSTD